MRKSTLARQLMRTTVLTGAAAAFAVPAFAQDTDDEIVVTGSRIAREDLAAPSPVQTVSSEQLVLTNTINTEQFLNTLPQVIPASTRRQTTPATAPRPFRCAALAPTARSSSLTACALSALALAALST